MVPKPALPVVEHQVQKMRTLRRQVSQKHQVDAATLAPSNSQTKHPNPQAQKVLRNPRANEFVQKVKGSKTVETRSESYTVNRSQITPIAAAAASQQLIVDKSLTVQRAELLNRLKQKPNRLKDSLTQLRTVGQQQAIVRSPEVAPNNDSAFLDAQMSPATADSAIVVSLERKIAVNEPTVVVPSIAGEYRVKAGDTLSEIAHHHGISLSELVKVNKLTDPDQLQINQRLTIPAFKYSSTVYKSASSSIPYNRAGGSQQESASVLPEPQTGTPPLGAAFSGIGGPISDETDQLSPPTFDQTQMAQSTAVPSGIGGSISEPKELQSNPYVQNLRTDIQRLRQKYYAQQKVSQDVPVESETVKEFHAAPAVQKQATQKQRPIQARSPVPATTRTSVAKAPDQDDASQSLESLKGRQVSPQLPPLGEVDTYLPKASLAPSKNYIWPARGVLTSGYGYRWGRMHKGIDVAAPIGTPIVAAAPGVVLKAGWNSGGYGNLVDIQHADGTLTRYAHNKRILVQAGELVEQGQQISEMGSSGYSTGPHLHFELRKAGKTAVNPIAYLPKR